MRRSNNDVVSSVGFVELLQIAFIVLKLVKAINWSWFWVLSPSWLSVVVVIMAIMIAIMSSERSNPIRKKENKDGR